MPYHHDPYDFSDTSSSEGSWVDIEDKYKEVDNGDKATDATSERSFGSHSSSTISKVCFAGFTNKEAGSITSYTRTSRSLSPAVESMSHSLRVEHGRLVSGLPGAIYKFPLDGAERWRISRQHRLLIQIAGGKYPPPMEAIMESFIPGEKRVLDLGCADGDWMQDVAREFPLCTVRGVDLAVTVSPDRLCTNTWIEAGDLNAGIPADGEYDVVHARFISAGISDYRQLIDRIARILRPGGLIEVVETDFRVYNKEGGCKVDSDSEPLWWTRLMNHIREAIQSTGADVDAESHLKEWVTNHGAFEDVGFRYFWVPITRGNDLLPERGEDVDASASSIATGFLESSRPLLLGSGMSEDGFDVLEQNVAKELHNPEVTQLACVTSVFATRRRDAHLVAEV